MNKKQKIILVGLSGGVDSAVAAAVLKNQGYKVIGAFMKNYSVAEHAIDSCNWKSERRDALKVALALNIPLLTLDFEEAYKKRVLDPFFNVYKNGGTPNPDIWCNSEIKFDLFYRAAKDLGADYIATGHYSTIEKIGDEYFIGRGADSSKDQSYFLSAINRDILSHVLFPLGGYKKSDVRVLAAKFKFPNTNKKDSQGICFVGPVDLADFIKAELGTNPGDIVNTKGKALGRHEGIWFYTLGQRKSINLASTEPLYVVGKNVAKNQIVVDDNPESPWLFATEVELKEVNWFADPKKYSDLVGESRLRQKPQTLKLFKTGSKWSAQFNAPQRALTIGQTLAVYFSQNTKQYLLGSGIIASVKNDASTH